MNALQDTTDIDWSTFPATLSELNPQLRQQAFTHRSLRAQKIRAHHTNERLEFLGDAVLELVISQYLYEQYPKWDEGRLTRYRAALVRTESLAFAAHEIGLGELLQTNVPEEGQLDEHSLPSYLADTFEAVLGAIYLDKGYQACQQFVKTYLLTYEDQLVTDKDAKDPKSRLQETLQSQGYNAPDYNLVKTQGPDHAKVFQVEVQIPNHQAVRGQGTSKQRAEQDAASNALIQYFPDQG